MEDEPEGERVQNARAGDRRNYGRDQQAAANEVHLVNDIPEGSEQAPGRSAARPPEPSLYEAVWKLA